MAAFVNIPRSDSEIWEHVDSFETRAEAIAFVDLKVIYQQEPKLAIEELETAPCLNTN